MDPDRHLTENNTYEQNLSCHKELYKIQKEIIKLTFEELKNTLKQPEGYVLEEQTLYRLCSLLKIADKIDIIEEIKSNEQKF